MTTPVRFVKLDVETASPAARPILAASAQTFGFLPSPVAKAAHSPALLKHLLAGFAAFDRGALSLLDREVVAMTVAFEVGCHYCVAMHSALLSREPARTDLVTALRAGAPLPDARLEALRQFVKACVHEHGHLSPAQWQAALDAGFEAQQLLDAVLGTGVYLLSTLTNIVTEAELDAPFESFRWEPATRRQPPVIAGERKP